MIPTTETLGMAMGRKVEGSDIHISFQTRKGCWCTVGVFYTLTRAVEEDEIPNESRYAPGIFLCFGRMQEDSHCEYQVISAEKIQGLKLVFDDEQITEFCDTVDMMILDDSLDAITEYLKKTFNALEDE